MEIYAELMRVYDSYQGSKAAEQLKKAEAYLEHIEEGQKLAVEKEKEILRHIEMAEQHKVEVAKERR